MTYWQRARIRLSAAWSRLRTSALGRRRTIRIAAASIAGVVFVTLLLLAMFPVGVLRGIAEDKLSEEFGAPVHIGALSRLDSVSFTPDILVRDVRIAQPAWAGKGDFLKAREIRTTLPIFALLAGKPSPRSIEVAGLDIALVRDAQGNSNWGGRARQPGSDRDPLDLAKLIVRDSRFSLRDAKRRLALSGTILADSQNGLRLSATGRFNGAPASLSARGAPLRNAARGTPWPFSVTLESAPLDLEAKGSMAGALNADDVTMTMTARGTSLKELDHVIEAGLFGTQDIALAGKVRRKGEDWFIDSLDGKIGRSTLHARATVLKRDDRTKIDATIKAPAFDFDDLADDAGLAAARAKEARIGKRVLPDTRIDLSRMGPTDGIIRFTIDRLLIEGGSAFRSLKGELKLDRRLLTLEKAVAGLDRGQVTGWVKIDSRQKTPIFSTELRVEGTSLETLIGSPDMIGGPLRGLVRVTGPGTTIREAFGNASGKIVFTANRGQMDRAAAFVLGQDLGGAIGEKLGGDDAMVPMRCAILSFQAEKGVLAPSPLLIDTAISSGRGRGQINLRDERVSLTLRGAAKKKAALKLVDPLRIDGTLSEPRIVVDGKGGKQGGGILRSIGRSIGSALGLRKDEQAAGGLPASLVNCDALIASALR